MSVQPPDRFENEEILRIFREINRSPEMTQRELSSRLGISLGKVNFLINALIENGFVKVENVRKSNSKSAYLYYLTPTGREEKIQTTHRSLERKIREHEQLAAEIRQLRNEVKGSGFPAKMQGRPDGKETGT